MKARLVSLGMVLVLAAVVTTFAACAKSGAENSATPTPTATALSTPTPTATVQPTPTATPSIYDRDIQVIDAAIAQYYTAHGQWPTASGQPGDIVWDKLVPAYLYAIPTTDAKCDWYVSSDPLGKVCRHGCSPCGCPGGEACK